MVFKELNTVFEEVEDKQGKYLGIKITRMIKHILLETGELTNK